MVATLQSILIGSGLIVMAGTSLLLNLFVFFMILYGGFLKSSQSGIYIFALANIVGNALQMALATFYLGPTSIIQAFPWPGEEKSFGAIFMSYLFLAQWYEEMFIQIIIAIDRLVTVVLPRYSWIFPRKIKIFLAIAVFPCGFTLAFFSDYVIDCCIAYIWFGDYSYAYLAPNGTFNHVDHYIDLPLNATSSTIALTCYFIIYVYILKSNRKAAGHMHESVVERRKAREIRYALQFGAISVFVLLAWVNFRVFPILVPLEIIGLYSLIAFCLICHCSSNAIIFITLNKEFKQKIKEKIWKRMSIYDTTNNRSRNSKSGKTVPTNNTFGSNFPSQPIKDEFHHPIDENPIGWRNSAFDFHVAA